MLPNHMMWSALARDIIERDKALKESHKMNRTGKYLVHHDFALMQAYSCCCCCLWRYQLLCWARRSRCKWTSRPRCHSQTDWKVFSCKRMADECTGGVSGRHHVAALWIERWKKLSQDGCRVVRRAGKDFGSVHLAAPYDVQKPAWQQDSIPIRGQEGLLWPWPVLNFCMVLDKVANPPWVRRPQQAILC